MSIQALPQTTVRAIGASQVLTDPAAVVKELIDNALDARATIISVEIHANTLDVIQVRDNGHGIAPQDRPLVARRYCTSKITGENDLKSIGGSSLGFRGEALASAAEMSGSMTVTTRIEGEQVATALNISQHGEIASQERASTSIGTTVRITDFINANPVRRQVALKRADQCLKRVKQLMQGYAFARPHARLSLRVLKAKNDKGNWMYAPKAGGNAEDAAFKIVGAACASQCIWSVVELHSFTLQAFLPKFDATAEKVSNIGSFLSVDGRPVSVARGTLKQVVKIFRETIKKTSSSSEGIKDPFLYLEIICPEASYDPNIEPAKDDVLFEDPDKVVEAARYLFSSVYPPHDEPNNLSITVQEPTAAVTAIHQRARALHDQEIDEDEDEDDDDGFITSLERRPADTQLLALGAVPSLPSTRSVEVETGNAAPTATIVKEPMVPPIRQSFRANMYGCDEEDLEAIDARPPNDLAEADFEELRRARNDVTISNPWVTAKLNSSIRQPQAAHEADSPARLAVATASQMTAGTSTPTQHQRIGLPTPRPSSPSVPNQPFHLSDFVPDIHLAGDGRLIGPSDLPLARHFAMSSPSPAVSIGVSHARAEMQTRPTYNYNVTSDHENAPRGTPLSAIPQARSGARASPRKQPRLNKPFVSPLVDGRPREKVWFDHLEGVENRRQPRTSRQHQQRDTSGLVTQVELGDSLGDSRTLTPPRRNRDIRDFVDSTDLNMEGRASLLRNFVESASPSRSDEHEENVPNNYGALVGRGFVPASELAALEARMGSFEKPAPCPTKRQKTGQRVLRQVSGNATPTSPLPPSPDAEEYRPEIESRKVSRRRSTAKLPRTKSSKLPLERIPPGREVYNLALSSALSPDDIVALERTIDVELSLLAWNEPAIDTFDTFAVQPDQDDVAAIASKLHELLINHVNDGEMVQDLGELVKRGLQAHAKMLAAEEPGATQAETEMDVSQV